MWLFLKHLVYKALIKYKIYFELLWVTVPETQLL
jgi:hypothetical protein